MAMTTNILPPLSPEEVLKCQPVEQRRGSREHSGTGETHSFLWVRYEWPDGICAEFELITDCGCGGPTLLDILEEYLRAYRLARFPGAQEGEE
jgi:hypothetical protein